MKVLSLTEPYATLIKKGVKTIETRSWKTNYRGKLYIHASSTRIPREYKANQELMSLVDIEELSYQRLTSVYTEDSELDFTALIESTYNNRLERLKELDDGWKKKYIEIDIDSMDQHQLDQWKRDAQPWPAFLSKATQEEAVIVLHRVEEALSRQRLNYIVSLIDQLTAEEKEKLLKMLQ